MHYQELETEKYFRQEVNRRNHFWRRARNRKAVRDFVTFLFGAAVIGITFQILARMTEWLPVVTEFLSNLGFPSA